MTLSWVSVCACLFVARRIERGREGEREREKERQTDRHMEREQKQEKEKDDVIVSSPPRGASFQRTDPGSSPEASPFAGVPRLCKYASP